MGKRSDFERRERDFYPTPYEAVVPLLGLLWPGTRFVEPCAGDGALVSHLHRHGLHCVSASDIEPQDQSVRALNAFDAEIGCAECFITNPPWDRSVLHPLIEHLSAQAPTWLLFDADWMHTKQSSRYLPWLVKIVSVGRVKWIPDSKMTGKDNCCWYLFDQRNTQATKFFGRD